MSPIPAIHDTINKQSKGDPCSGEWESWPKLSCLPYRSCFWAMFWGILSAHIVEKLGVRSVKDNNPPLYKRPRPNATRRRTEADKRLKNDLTRYTKRLKLRVFCSAQWSTEATRLPSPLPLTPLIPRFEPNANLAAESLLHRKTCPPGCVRYGTAHRGSALLPLRKDHGVVNSMPNTWSS